MFLMKCQIIISSLDNFSYTAEAPCLCLWVQNITWTSKDLFAFSALCLYLATKSPNCVHVHEAHVSRRSGVYFRQMWSQSSNVSKQMCSLLHLGRSSVTEMLLTGEIHVKERCFVVFPSWCDTKECRLASVLTLPEIRGDAGSMMCCVDDLLLSLCCSGQSPVVTSLTERQQIWERLRAYFNVSLYRISIECKVNKHRILFYGRTRDLCILECMFWKKIICHDPSLNQCSDATFTRFMLILASESQNTPDGHAWRLSVWILNDPRVTLT